MLPRTRSRTQAILRLHPNEEIAHALHSIQPLLDQHKLQWHDHGRHPDCQFTSFIHASKKTIPSMEEIMDVRRACKRWVLAHPSPQVESASAWRDKIIPFGFGDVNTRKQGNDHSLRGLAGAFKTRINVIVVRTSGHHILQYNPPENIQHLQELWLIYMDLENTHHYLSTIPDMTLSIPPPPPPTMRGANGNPARARRATGSTEPINDPALVAGSSSRVAVSVPARQTLNASQGASQDSQPIIEDIFANIHHVQGDFVHRLIQNGTLKFLQQIYKAGTLWTPRDCRSQRTSPSEEAYKEFTKCLTLILTAAKLYPLKTLQRELLTYVAKQLPFFIFPPNRCRHKRQNHLIKRASSLTK